MKLSMNKTRKKAFLFSFLVAMGVLLCADVSAQSQERPGGLFGYKFNTTTSGMMNRSNGVVGSNLNGQGFGATEGNITGQTFGAPLGSGLFVLLVAGAGYATLKAKKKQQQTRKENKA
ncbi:MAG: hypothetical protein K6G25_00820 [Bacteroidales bacterium]|nr:hypothetical protein [Bacteroidales bacterium]